MDLYIFNILIGSLIFAISGLGFVSLIMFLIYYFEGDK
jgi:hypothetical protein